MDLRVAGVREEGALLVRTPCGGHVAALGVCAQEEHVAVAARAQQHAIGRMSLHLAGHEVTRDDPLRVAFHRHHVQHFAARVHLHPAAGDFLVQRRVGPEQQLLTGLAARIKRTAHLRTAKGAVCQHAAVLAGKGHALGHALVDDVHADLGQTMHIRFTGAEVAALDRVVEQAEHRVPVVLVVLRRIDPALGGNGMRTARAVLEAEALHLVAQLGQGGRGSRSGKAAAHHDHAVLALVLRIDQLRITLVIGPLVSKRAGGDVGIEGHSSV